MKSYNFDKSFELVFLTKMGKIGGVIGGEKALKTDPWSHNLWSRGSWVHLTFSCTSQAKICVEFYEKLQFWQEFWVVFFCSAMFYFHFVRQGRFVLVLYLPGKWLRNHVNVYSLFRAVCYFVKWLCCLLFSRWRCHQPWAALTKSVSLPPSADHD